MGDTKMSKSKQLSDAKHQSASVPQVESGHGFYDVGSGSSEPTTTPTEIAPLVNPDESQTLGKETDSMFNKFKRSMAESKGALKMAQTITGSIFFGALYGMVQMYRENHQSLTVKNTMEPKCHSMDEDALRLMLELTKFRKYNENSFKIVVRGLDQLFCIQIQIQRDKHVHFGQWSFALTVYEYILANYFEIECACKDPYEKVEMSKLKEQLKIKLRDILITLRALTAPTRID